MTYMSTHRVAIPMVRTTRNWIFNYFRVELYRLLLENNSGAYRARTYDPLLVRQMLSQLS